MITCGFEMYRREVNVLSYNIGLFVFVFVMPIVTFMATNIKILTTVSYRKYFC